MWGGEWGVGGSILTCRADPSSEREIEPLRLASMKLNAERISPRKRECNTLSACFTLPLDPDRGSPRALDPARGSPRLGGGGLGTGADGAGGGRAALVTLKGSAAEAVLAGGVLSP